MAATRVVHRMTRSLVLAGVLVTVASCAGESAGPPDAGTPTSAPTSDAPAADPGTCEAFSLSLYSDRGGRPDPVAAAEWFAANGGTGGIPSSGWSPDGEDETGVLVRSGDAVLHVVQGPDATWQVDSGQVC